MDPLLTVAVITLVGVGIVAGFIAYHDHTEIQPKAEAQYLYLQTITCEEVSSFPSSTTLYSKENRILLNEKTKTCTEAKQREAQKAKERLDALLADPDSFESLSREYAKLKESLEESQTRYDILQNETGILQEKIAEYENRIAEIIEKIDIPDE